METYKDDDDSIKDISIDDMNPKQLADTSRAATIIDFLKISDNLLGQIAALQNHMNHLTKYTKSLQESRKFDHEIIKSLEARLSTQEKKQESMKKETYLCLQNCLKRPSSWNGKDPKSEGKPRSTTEKTLLLSGDSQAFPHPSGTLKRQHKTSDTLT